MGQKGGQIFGGALLIAGGVLIAFTGNWAFAFAIASAGVGAMTAPVQRNKEGAMVAVPNINTGTVANNLPVVYGTARVAGLFTDVRVDNNSPSRKALHLVMALCHGSQGGGGVQGIKEIWLNSRLAVSGLVVQPPFNANGFFQSVPLLIYKYVAFFHALGSTTQTVDPTLKAAFPVQWPNTSKGAGVCYTHLTLFFSNDLFPGGLPAVQATVQGARVFDPRDSTTKFTTNPALCIRDYLTSPIYGMGVDPTTVDDNSFIDSANYCDEIVTLPDDSSQKRYELNGVVDTSKTVQSNLADLCSACRGTLVNESGKWRLVIRRARVVSGFKITEENTVEGSWRFVLPGTNTPTGNIVQTNYINPGNFQVDTIFWPDPGVDNVYLDEDNGFEQLIQIDLPFTQNQLMAQQLGMTTLKEGRHAILATCTIKESGLYCHVGDIVEVTQPTPGWVDKPFDVVALLVQPDSSVQAILQSYEPTVYDVDEQFPQPVNPDTNLPDAFSCPAPANVVLTVIGQELFTSDGGFIPRIRVTWTKSNDPFVDHYIIQAKKSSESTWDDFGPVPAASDPQFFVTPVTPESWDVQIQAVNTLGVHSGFVTATVTVVVPDVKPQITTITLTNAHSDVSHTDLHSDVAHGDSVHGDSHSDTAHTDHTDHSDSHGDGGHDDVAHDDTHGDIGHIDTDHTDTHSDAPHTDHGDSHGDSHSDSNHSDTVHGDAHGDIGAIDTDHTDTHSDNAHADHSDSGLSHTDVTHVDGHTDNPHSDSTHADGHTDSAHGDGQYGLGASIQADKDTASVRAVAIKHGDHTDGTHTDVTDPTAAQVRSTHPVDGRNTIVPLLDVATGDPILLNPGDQIRIGVLAYSQVAGGGVEGPLALGSGNLFQASVAPVGTDKWWPA